MPIVRRVGLSADVAPMPSSGRYYQPVAPGAASTNNGLGNGTLRLAPWVVAKQITIDRVGGDIATVGEAGSKLRIGIYQDNGNCFPGGLLLDAGQIAGDSATVQELTCSLTLPRGLYWLGGAVQSASTTQPTVRIVPGGGGAPPAPLIYGSALPDPNISIVGLSNTGVTGALPATFSSTFGTVSSVPRVFVRVS